MFPIHFYYLCNYGIEKNFQIINYSDMKKFFLIGVLAALTAFSAAAQDKENTPAPRTSNIEQIQLALRLAEYGYANYAPVA